MIPILSAQQTHEADQFTIAHEPIASIDLMERASSAFVEQLLKVLDIKGTVHVFCGTGNNGGDGLAVSRLLSEKGLVVVTYALGDLERSSADFQVNYQRLAGKATWIKAVEQIEEINDDDVVIDALFGSGLTRPIEGLKKVLIHQLNITTAKKVALDIASGLYADTLPAHEDTIFHPDITITFQTPSWTFFQPSMSDFVGQFYVVDIGLDLTIFEKEDIKYYQTTIKDLAALSKEREKYSHKGDFGRLLIISGSQGKMGAAVMATKAALRSGAGLVYAMVPDCGVDILQNQVCEAMVLPTEGLHQIEKIEVPDGIDVLAIGPGLGMGRLTMEALDQLLSSLSPDQKLILDADAINILSKNREWLSRLPEETILTPHPGEFSRLVGGWSDDMDKTHKLREFCSRYRINMVVKGAFSAVCDSGGMIHYNSTGNPGMATGGSGDVLTGIIAGLMSSGIGPFAALKAGVYVHGKSGDLAAAELGERSLIAGDLIDYLPMAFRNVNN
jgi:hydroxyethylthiazole kinase-like uncharacterized protein yjeF